MMARFWAIDLISIIHTLGEGEAELATQGLPAQSVRPCQPTLFNTDPLNLVPLIALPTVFSQ